MRRLTALVLLAGCLAAAASAATVQSQVFHFRWPATGKKAAYVVTLRRTSTAPIKSVRILVDGVAVDNKADYIVACAHRGPSFANASWSAAAHAITARIQLESGFCKPGPKTAGTLAAVKIVATYR